MDSTTLLDQVTIAAGSDVRINELFDAHSVSSAFGRRAATCTGLVWGYYGCRYGGTAVANGTNTCGASTTTYMVASRSTGAVSFATTTTNWNDNTNYGRCYKLTTGASTVTGYEDHRFGPNGINSQAATGGGTVTATAGSLTSNAVVLGAGTTDTKVVSGITTDGASRLQLGVAGASVGGLELRNATSGTMSIVPPTGALGTTVLTGLAASDTLVGIAATQTLTNKTLTSPTLTAPVLGTPASGNLSNCTADGTDTVGFRGIPQNSQSAAYTLVLADAGKHIYHPSGDANARTFTIPANGSVAFPIGTSVTFINETSQVVSIAITTDTLVLATTGSTGTRSLAQYGVATAVKVTSTRWYISGSGLT